MQSDQRTTLIVSHMRIVHTIMRQYYIPTLWEEDIRQEGNLGLTVAADHFDPSHGIRFSSYAAWWVRKFILEALRSYGQIVRLPRHELPEHIFTEELGKIVRVEDDEPLTYEDILPGDDFADAHLTEAERQEAFAGLLAQLSARELQVLGLFYGLEQEPVPTVEIAKQLGVTQRQVERIVKNSVKKLL